MEPELFWVKEDAPQIVRQHDQHHDRAARADTFDRVRQMLIAAIEQEGSSDELSCALQHIKTGFLWIAEHHRTR